MVGPPILAFYDQQVLLRTYLSPGGSIRSPHPRSPRGEEVKKLLEEQKALNNQLNIEKDQTKREEMARNTKLNKIHQSLEEEKHAKLVEQVEEIEKLNKDYRMFKALKIIANNEKRKPLLIQGTEGLTAKPQEQAEFKAKHFENIFRDEDLEEITPPFTADKVKKAIKSLKNNVRKILAICLIRRIGGKIDENIQIEQAAYRAGRGTTEHTFAYKILADKAIRSKGYEPYITLKSGASGCKFFWQRIPHNSDYLYLRF